MAEAGQKIILLVEDEAITAMIEKRQLESEGYQVIHVLNGEKAIELVCVKKQPVDLILMDIDLGKGMDGTQTAQEILKVHDIPTLFLSSHIEKDVVAKTESITNYGYVVKNSSFTVLDASIKMAFKLFEASKLINKHRMQNEAAYEEMQAINNNLVKTQKKLIEKEQTFRSLFEKAPIGTAYHRMVYDASGKPINYWILEANKSYQILTGTVDPVGKLVTDAFPGIENDPFDWIGVFGNVAKTGKEIRFTQNLQYNNRWYDLVAYQNKPDHFVVSFFEISKNKNVEKALEKERLLLKIITETSPVGIATVDVDGNITYVNVMAEKILGLSKGTITSKKYNSSTWKVTGMDGQPFPDEQQPFTLVKTTKKPVYDIRHAIEWVDRKKVSLSVNASPILDDNGNFVGMVATFDDITERIKAEEVFEEKNNILSTLLDNLPMGVFMVEAPSGKPLVANEIAKQLLGRGILPDVNVESIGEVYQAYKGNEKYPTEEMPIIRALRGRKSHVEDMIVKKPDGTSSLLEVYGSPVMNKDRKVSASLVSFIDISKRKNYEQKIINLLKEKETILKEVNHRIKNNMNVMGALLRLQSDAQVSQDTKSILLDVDGRIKSMMVLYDKLYLSDSKVKLSLKEYLPSLLKEITSIFSDNQFVKIETQVEDIILDAKLLSPLGIILNELITNSMKYAFKNQEGVIRVNAAMEGRLVRIEYQDNGIGLPEIVDFENTTGFGMQLIKMLVEQINATIKIERGNGTKFVIMFDPCCTSSC